METVRRFSLFPTSNLLFSPFKIFFAECKVWVKPKPQSLYFISELIMSRQLKINVEALGLF